MRGSDGRTKLPSEGVSASRYLGSSRAHGCRAAAVVKRLQYLGLETAPRDSREFASLGRCVPGSMCFSRCVAAADLASTRAGEQARVPRAAELGGQRFQVWPALWPRSALPEAEKR